MNKYLIVAILVVIVAGAIYWTSLGETSAVHATNGSSVSTPEAAIKVDNSVTSVAETSEKTPRAATHTSSESQRSVTSITVEQTQNAVDFNAPGAGTAEQKAGAAAAANKAYQESKQQGQ
jgi:hypothetical protein